MAEIVIALRELESLLTHVRSRGNRLRSRFEHLQHAFGQVASSEALTGAVKEAIDLGIENKHLPMIKTFIETYHVIEDEISDMMRHLRTHLNEQAPNGIISESALDEAKRQFVSNAGDNERREHTFNRIYEEISDLIDLPRANRIGFDHEHDRLMGDTETLKEGIHHFRYRPHRLGEMVRNLTQEIRALESVMDKAFDDPGRLAVKENGEFLNWISERTVVREQILADRAFLENFQGPISAYGIRFGLMSHDILEDLWRNWTALGSRATLEDFINTLEEPQRSQFLWLKGFTEALVAIAGDPVNMSTGNFLYAHEDIRIEGSYPLVFRRFYNSIDSHVRDLGKNWCHTYQIDLTEMKDGRVAVMYEDGHLEFYTATDAGTYTAQRGVFTQLTKYPGNALALDEMEQLARYELTFLDGRVYHFNAFGLLTKQVDANENETRLTYEGANLIKVETPSGHLSFSHRADGFIESMTDHTGRRLIYEYDQGNLTVFKDMNENEMKHLYDEKGRLIKVLNREGQPVFDQVYDEKDRASKQTFVDGSAMRYAYEEEQKKTVFTWQNGTEMIYQHNDNYLTTGIIYPDSEEKIAFNASNQRISFTDKLGNTSRFAYDAWGNGASIY